MIMKFTLKKLRGFGNWREISEVPGKRFPCLYSLVSFPSFFLPEKGKLIDIS